MELPKQFNARSNYTLITSLAMGILAATAQGFFKLQPPVGDGVCYISHQANLVN